MSAPAGRLRASRASPRARTSAPMPGLWSCSSTKRSISPRNAAKFSPPCCLQLAGDQVDAPGCGWCPRRSRRSSRRGSTARPDGPARSRRRRRSGWPARRRGTPDRRSTPSRSASGDRPGPGGRRPWPSSLLESACARSAWSASFTASVRMPSTLAFISSSMRRTSECSMMGTRGAFGSLKCGPTSPACARARSRGRSGTPSTPPRGPARRPRCARRSSCGTSASCPCARLAADQDAAALVVLAEVEHGRGRRR